MLFLNENENQNENDSHLHIADPQKVMRDLRSFMVELFNKKTGNFDIARLIYPFFIFSIWWDIAKYNLLFLQFLLAFSSLRIRISFSFFVYLFIIPPTHNLS